MPTATDPPAACAPASGSPAPPVSFAEADADFARKLDLWGAYHRMVVATLTMAVAFGLLPHPDWLLWLAALYLGIAALVPAMLELANVDARKAYVRAVVMVIDVALVSLFVYHWGARSSPAAFMYVPIVSGWTLIPQRHLGRMAGFATLFAYGSLLAADQFGWLSDVAPPSSVRADSSPTSALLYFATLASAVVAVHGLVDFTFAQLREHSEVISRLTSERREQELETQLAGQLEEAQRLEALGRLAGGLAHDFNNLLTVLMGCAELAELGLARRDHAAAQRALHELSTAAERGARLTAQLLDFASRRPLSPRDLDLKRAMVDAGQLLEHLLEANIELQVQTCNEPCVVHLDPGSLERLLLNLAVNARDAMPNGGVLTLAISVRHLKGGEQVVLEVRDSGVGIAAKDLPHIFEPFFTTKARGRGTGLGLASVYGIVRQSQGQIEVESSPGAGTTFHVRWPRVPVSTGATKPEPAPKTSGGELLLLVDDDAEVRAVAMAQLESAGYRVLPAGSGEDALELLAARPGAIDMVISDVSMPGMSGVEFARRVRGQLPQLPILLISGYSEELHGKLEGLARFLAKPFSRQRLLAEVRQALERPD